MPVVTDYTALLSGKYWNGIEVAGAPVIVTYSFPTTLPAYDATIAGFNTATDQSFAAFTAAEQTEAQQALGEWAAASGLIFIQVAPGQGDINFQNVNLDTTSNPSYAGAGGIGFYPFGDWGNSSYPYFTSDLDSSGDVFMNSVYQAAGDGSVNYGTLLHEIGHAIGLKHPTETVIDGAAQPNPVVHDQVLSSDDPSLTIMATTEDASTGADSHLQQLDKDAAAFLYGSSGGGIYTASASGTNSVADWSWDASTQTLTQTALVTGEVVRGTSVNDIIHGLSGDKLFALDGDDTLYGGGGNDSLYGGPGTDTLYGGPGGNAFYVNSATTTVIENNVGSSDTVYATVSFTLPVNVDTLYLYGSGLTGTANDQGDTFFGDGTSGQIMNGGAGNDVYHVYSATNIVEQANQGYDAIYSTVSFALPANVEELHLFGVGLTGTANDLNDALYGDPTNGTTLIAGAGDDYMVGFAGNDVLVAGTGTETMYGNGGSDNFVFNSTSDAAVGANPTTIADFSEGADTMDLSGIKTSGGQDLTFIGSGPFSGAAGEVRQFSSNGNTIVEGDVNGGGSPDFEIQLTGGLTLQSRDFVFASSACYRAGTRILTKQGEIEVERLAIGDDVMTASGRAARIEWIGHRRIDCSRHPDPCAVWPIRVRAGAFGERLPHRDLFLSPDHSVFVDQVLIPIKHLANGTTIAQVPAREVTYYHVELPRHDVILAEGLPAESYLDTGNRGDFANGVGVSSLHPLFEIPKTWRDDAVAPLALDDARVRPVWERLAARSHSLGLPIPKPAFTDDPALRLRVDGRAIRPTVLDQRHGTFILPAHGRSIRLISRSGHPTDARPWATDRRLLGVCVHRVVWHDIEGPHDMPVDHPALEEGWWDVERTGESLRRWTNGDALLPIPPDAIAVEIWLAGSLDYRVGIADEAASGAHAMPGPSGAYGRPRRTVA